MTRSALANERVTINSAGQLVPQDPGQATSKSGQTASQSGCAHSRSARIRWARLLKRVFEIDMEHCPNCGGQLKIIAAILEAAVIKRIHTHLGLQARESVPVGPETCRLKYLCSPLPS